MADDHRHEEVLRELADTEDYYTLLNVGKTADQDEIRRAYHRLCRLYHPDRYQDEKKQNTATEFFRRIQEAYKVLSDPRTRAIYDKRGHVGLEEDMAVIERTTLPSELLEEYEKLRELWEERSYIQNCNPAGEFKMEVDATSLVDGTEYFGQSPGMSVERYYVQQSVDAAITKSTVGQVAGVLSAQSYQNMVGGIQFSLRRMYAHQNWFRVSAFMGSRPNLGLSGYHVLGEGMYVTGHSSVSFVGSLLRFGASVSIHRRLSDSTTGTLTIQDLGRVTSVKLTNQVSPTTNVLGEVSIGAESSHLKSVVNYQPVPNYVLKAGIKAGTEGVNVLYGIEHLVTKMTSVGSTVLVGPTHGVTLKLKLQRASMSYQVRIKLSDFVGVAAIFYATSLPLVVYGCIKVLAIAPLLRNEWLKEIKEKKLERAKEVLEKKKTAEAAVELMQETVERVISIEQARHGLLIVEAWYGKLFDQQSDADALEEPKVIDVRIPLQCLVADSKLILHEATKANIPGIYDPCIGERKYLRVGYEFRGVAHEVTIENSEPLVIPRMSHRVINQPEL